MVSRQGIALSLGLHALLVVLLTASVDFVPDDLVEPSAPRPIVQATVIDQAAVEKEVERLRAADREAARQREQEEAKTRELEQKRKAEEKRLAELEARRQRAEKERKAAAKARAEAQAKAAAARQAAEQAEARKREAEQQAEQRRQAEEAARQEAEQKREAARQAAERKRIEEELQAQIAAEEAAAREAAEAAEINRFVAAIAQRVRQSFTILPGLEGLSCTLRITLVPSGDVAGVQVVRSSGNETFDRQAENAVRKAAPLPVPREARLFQQMRTITFVFDPQN